MIEGVVKPQAPLAGQHSQAPDQALPVALDKARQLSLQRQIDPLVSAKEAHVEQADVQLDVPLMQLRALRRCPNRLADAQPGVPQPLKERR